MRGFIVLCLSAVAIAAPQGYNYSPAGGVHQSAQQGYNTNFGFNGASSALNTAASSSGYFNGGQSAHGFLSQGSSNSVAQHQQQFVGQQQQQAIVSKRFFIHSAPEEVEEDYKEKHITVGVPKKNYNVVFIKAPAKSSKKTAIKISPAVNEEKTVIYVLSKKTDAADINAEVLEHATSTTKPEVFFIKYKTNEEATHAQEQIQAQYDALGGSSQVSDEGTAPVTSVIGSLGDAGAGAGGSIGGASGGHFNGGAIGGASGGHFNAGAIGGSSIHNGQGGVINGGGSNANSGYLPPNF